MVSVWCATQHDELFRVRLSPYGFLQLVCFQRPSAFLFQGKLMGEREPPVGRVSNETRGQSVGRVSNETVQHSHRVVV